MPQSIFYLIQQAYSSDSRVFYILHKGLHPHIHLSIYSSEWRYGHTPLRRSVWIMIMLIACDHKRSREIGWKENLNEIQQAPPPPPTTPRWWHQTQPCCTFFSAPDLLPGPQRAVGSHDNSFLNDFYYYCRRRSLTTIYERWCYFTGCWHHRRTNGPSSPAAATNWFLVCYFFLRLSFVSLSRAVCVSSGGLL